MKIGYSYWGFCEPFERSHVAQTPDGFRYCRPLFIDELIRQGHEVVALQAKREESPYPGLKYDDDGYPELDMLLVEWRWKTYKNSGPTKFEPDYDRQQQLLEHYHGKVPMVIWDLDLKLTAEDELTWRQAIIADASLRPVPLTRPRTVFTIWSDFKEILPVSAGSLEFGYVGNNYERREQLEKYYVEPSKSLRELGIQTKLWGNWLQRSPERASPEELISQYPYLALCDRVGLYESMQILNRFITVVHITKEQYAVQGHVPARYFESLAVRTPALVPSEHAFSNILGKKWRVASAADVIDRVRYLKTCSVEDRLQIVLEQEHALRRVRDFSVETSVRWCAELAKNPSSALKNY